MGLPYDPKFGGGAPNPPYPTTAVLAHIRLLTFRYTHMNEEDEQQAELRQLVLDKIEETDQLISRCRAELSHIDGTTKLANKIKSEKAFLQSVSEIKKNLSNKKR